MNRLHKKYAKPQKFAQSSIRVHSMAEIRSGIGVFGSFRQLTGIGTVIVKRLPDPWQESPCSAGIRR
ncbi:MAG TPA: hypothetical protein PKA58_04800, partial [Polyangium sp.]|nr:hypothetical protein [Polyangium sp.]